MKKIIPTGNVLIVMVGPSGAGKSTFVQKHFEPREVVSSDAIREELTGQFERQDKNDLVFQEFHHRIRTRLQAGQRAVADATHLRTADRKATVRIATDMGVPVVYVVVNRPVEHKVRTAGWREHVRIHGTPLIQSHETTFAANEADIRAGDNGLADLVVDTRVDQFCVPKAFPRDPQAILPRLAEDGFEFIRVIGDVHGNMAGLKQALAGVDDRGVTFFLFLGDIMDYGQHTLETTEIVSTLVSNGQAVCIRGNHERKVLRFVERERGNGFQGQTTHGNNITFNRLKALAPKQRLKWESTLINLVEQSPDWIQIGPDWLFTHGACHPDMWDNSLFRAHRNSQVETFALFGETNGTKGPDGFPTRLYNWVEDIPRAKTVVVGHAIRSVDEPLVVHGRDRGRAIFLDTGSSKALGNHPGKLSWMDLEIKNVRKLGFKLEEIGFGSE